MSHWQQKDYKGFAPNVDWDTVDFSKSPAIQEMPVVSAICDPAPEELVVPKAGKLTVRGACGVETIDIMMMTKMIIITTSHLKLM